MVPVPAFAEADNQQTPTLLFEHIDRHLLAVALLTYVTGICAYMDRITLHFTYQLKRCIQSFLLNRPAHLQHTAPLGGTASTEHGGLVSA